MLINKIHYDFFHLFIFFSLLFKKVQKVHCSTFTADCSLFKKTHCHSIVIHSHTIVSICNAVRKQLCDHCINYCVTIVIIVHCSLFTDYCLLFTDYCLLITVYCLLFTDYCLLFTVYCLLFFFNLVFYYSLILKIYFVFGCFGIWLWNLCNFFTF